MILYYALGGGLGHLTRARAVAHTLGLADLTLLAASPHAANRRVGGALPVIAAPPALAADRAAWRDWLAALLDRLAPAALYLDAFPVGILGELCDFSLPPGLPVHYLARRLRWAVYGPLLAGQPPTLTVAHRLEPLEADHERFLRAHARTVAPLALRDPPAALPPTAHTAIAALTAAGRPLWLVVHAGPDDETAELLAYAADLARLEGRDPALAVIAPAPLAELPPGVGYLDVYPATPLFPLADRIITAAGFNAMRQLAPFRHKHRYLPFPRRYDDQFARAAWVTAGRDGVE